MRILFTRKDFHGWTPGAIREDSKFDAEHLAVVAETQWQHAPGWSVKRFTSAKVRMFDWNELAEARRWLRG